MYSENLCFSLISEQIRRNSDDLWLQHRMNQFASEDTTQLCTKWQFRMIGISTLGYSWALFQSVASYALVFFNL